MLNFRRLLKSTTSKTSPEQKEMTSWKTEAPVFSTAPVGVCQFTETWKGVALKGRVAISPDTYVYTFATPDEDKPLGLSTSACILAKGLDKDGNDVIKPYTPCSTNAMIGQFQCMIKTYPGGKMTNYLKELPIGSLVEFKHIEFNVKIQYPYNKKEILMLVGGSGITPMLQALNALLGNPDDTTKVTVLFSNKMKADILAKETLDHWATLSDRLNIEYILTKEEGGKRIDKQMVENTFGTANQDKLVLVCGPPAMYTSFCGPRDQKEVTGILADLGYDSSTVFKF